MRLVVIDHEDSFVHNLAQAFSGLGAEVRTLRYYVPFRSVCEVDPDAVVLSPGPGHPSDPVVGRLDRRILSEWSGRRPILGVCLGHQIIAQAAGARIERAPQPIHGVASPVRHDRSGLFEGLPSPLLAGRYHSYAVEAASIAPPLERTACSTDGVVMALRNLRAPTYGVQFHPESILTPEGPRILANFLREVRR
jgi:anthranilate synthase/aminodeoxychorismate synthase-like glutamine amidotransferase